MDVKDMRDYSTLHLDIHLRKGTALCIQWAQLIPYHEFETGHSLQLSGTLHFSLLQIYNHNLNRFTTIDSTIVRSCWTITDY